MLKFKFLNTKYFKNNKNVMTIDNLKDIILTYEVVPTPIYHKSVKEKLLRRNLIKF